MRCAGGSTLLLLAILAACRVPNEPAPYDDGHYALTLGVTVAPATPAVAAGASSSVLVGVARGGGLNGSVFLQAEGVPADVTVTFAPHPLSGPVTGAP